MKNVGLEKEIQALKQKNERITKPITVIFLSEIFKMIKYNNFIYKQHYA
jgi:hypothetical protein